MRVTSAHLDSKVNIINGYLGFDDLPSWNTVGAIHLYRAYSGTGVHRVCNEHGGVTSLCELGTAREANQFLSGMIAALRIARDEQVKR